jgi:hypothetical protein
MSDDTTKPSPTAPTALESVLRAVEARKETAKGSGPGSWIAYLILAALALVGIGVFAWTSYRRARRLAELEHQRTVEKEQKARLELDNKNEINLQEVQKAEAQIQVHRDQIKEIDKQIEEVRAEKVKNDAAIDKITTWSDIAPSDPDKPKT